MSNQNDNQPVVWAVLVAVIILAVGLAVGFGIAKSKKPAGGRAAKNFEPRYGSKTSYQDRKRRPGENVSVVDTCHAWASDGDAVRRNYPDLYTGAGD